MRAIYTDWVDENKGIVTIVSADTPASLNITGADVEGLPDDFILAAGSVIITPTTNYVAFGEGEFTEKSNGGGSGGGGGASGVLAIHADPNTGRFDKTFRQVVNAIDAGMFVFIVFAADGDQYGRDVHPLGMTSENDGKYYVEDNLGNNVYVCDDPDEYPEFSEG